MWMLIRHWILVQYLKCTHVIMAITTFGWCLTCGSHGAFAGTKTCAWLSELKCASQLFYCHKQATSKMVIGFLVSTFHYFFPRCTITKNFTATDCKIFLIDSCYEPCMQLLPFCTPSGIFFKSSPSNTYVTFPNQRFDEVVDTLTRAGWTVTIQ